MKKLVLAVVCCLVSSQVYGKIWRIEDYIRSNHSITTTFPSDCSKGGYLDYQPEGKICTPKTYKGISCFENDCVCDTSIYKYVNGSNCPAPKSGGDGSCKDGNITRYRNCKCDPNGNPSLKYYRGNMPDAWSSHKLVECPAGLELGGANCFGQLYETCTCPTEYDSTQEECAALGGDGDMCSEVNGTVKIKNCHCPDYYVTCGAGKTGIGSPCSADGGEDKFSGCSTSLGGNGNTNAPVCSNIDGLNNTLAIISQYSTLGNGMDVYTYVYAASGAFNYNAKLKIMDANSNIHWHLPSLGEAMYLFGYDVAQFAHGINKFIEGEDTIGEENGEEYLVGTGEGERKVKDNSIYDAVQYALQYATKQGLPAEELGAKAYWTSSEAPKKYAATRAYTVSPKSIRYDEKQALHNVRPVIRLPKSAIYFYGTGNTGIGSLVTEYVSQNVVLLAAVLPDAAESFFNHIINTGGSGGRSYLGVVYWVDDDYAYIVAMNDASYTYDREPLQSFPWFPMWDYHIHSNWLYPALDVETQGDVTDVPNGPWWHDGSTICLPYTCSLLGGQSCWCSGEYDVIVQEGCSALKGAGDAVVCQDPDGVKVKNTEKDKYYVKAFMCKKANSIPIDDDICVIGNGEETSTLYRGCRCPTGYMTENDIIHCPGFIAYSSLISQHSCLNLSPNEITGQLEAKNYNKCYCPVEWLAVDKAEQCDTHELNTNYVCVGYKEENAEAGEYYPCTCSPTAYPYTASDCTATNAVAQSGAGNVCYYSEETRYKACVCSNIYSKTSASCAQSGANWVLDETNASNCCTGTDGVKHCQSCRNTCSYQYDVCTAPTYTDGGSCARGGTTYWEKCSCPTASYPKTTQICQSEGKVLDESGECCTGSDGVKHCQSCLCNTSVYKTCVSPLVGGSDSCTDATGTYYRSCVTPPMVCSPGDVVYRINTDDTLIIGNGVDNYKWYDQSKFGPYDEAFVCVPSDWGDKVALYKCQESDYASSSKGWLSCACKGKGVVTTSDKSCSSSTFSDVYNGYVNVKNMRGVFMQNYSYRVASARCFPGSDNNYYCLNGYDNELVKITDYETISHIKTKGTGNNKKYILYGKKAEDIFETIWQGDYIRPEDVCMSVHPQI